MVGLMVLNLLAFISAVAVGIHTPFWLILYLPLFSVLQLTLMRVIRIVAILQELIFAALTTIPTCRRVS
jgi:hypothetical protein